MTPKLGQIAFHVHQLDAAEKFFTAHLGFALLFRTGNMSFLDCGGVRVMLTETSSQLATSSAICHYFVVADIDAAFRRMSEAGVTFTDRPHLIAKMPDHELWMVFFNDPNGHALALMEERR